VKTDSAPGCLGADALKAQLTRRKEEAADAAMFDVRCLRFDVKAKKAGRA
jgi:hypothetical protein